MSLNKHNAIPVDTHVWQIAQREYGFSVKTKGKSNSLTSRNYEAVGDHFREIFGEYSGWAHSVILFISYRFPFLFLFLVFK
jgi:N-glycosylase/DNA lyase